MSSYTATYHTGNHRFYQANLLFSTVTLTIRYYDEQNFHQEIHWLAKEILSLEERPMEAELQYRSVTGQLEKLIIRDEATLEAIKKNFRQYKFVGSVSGRLFGSIASKLALSFAIFFGLILAAYLWFIPWLGERVAMGFSKNYEISLGDQMYQSVITTYKVDSHKTALLNEFYEQLHYKTDYPVHITVVSSEEMNAFAIPGGHIVVYDAILNNMKTPEELAALLGHEASHVALRHSLRNMFRSLARKMFLSLIIGSESGIAAVVVNNADNLKGLEYSRALETEADNNGLKLMADNSIDTQGMVRLMQLLQQESGQKSSSTANFFSTHPVFDKRIDQIKQQLKQYPSTPTANDKLKIIFHALYENPGGTQSW